MSWRRTAVLLALCPLAAAAAGRSLVLEDFESAAAARKWEGLVRISSERASHGTHSAEIRFDNSARAVTTSGLPRDWRGYDRLVFDLYSGRPGMSTGTIRIYDAVGGDAGKTQRDDYYDARDKIFVQKGWNHVIVKLTPLRAATYLRDMALDRILRVTIEPGRASLPWTVYLDNFRLVSGVEPAETASRTEPQDTVTIIDNRWFTVKQVARAEDVPEAASVTNLRADAQREFDSLKRAIAAAQMQGIDTIYAERHLVTGELGLRVRPRLAWFNNDESKREMYSYVAESCRAARRELEDEMQGIRRLPEVDDTQVAEPAVRPFPPLKGRPVRDWFFLDDRGDPMMIVSLHSPSRMLERFFATPLQHIESYSVGGGSRWTIDSSPVYEVFKKYPDTHRVGWDGWCGHLVRDLDSMGGTKKENVVICLESPRIRQAVEEYIRINIPKFHSNPQLLYNIMAYELMYICYCERSQQMFREWLTQKHGTVGKANQLWGTDYQSFKDVVAPPVLHSRPLPGTNRALWYDWARFNQDRFTDYLLWVRSVIRKLDPSVPLAAGGSSSMLAGRTGTTGIDEERIVNEVDDVIIHEGGGSTLGVDLQLALSEKKKPLADPEMSLSSVHNLFPHFLHGKSVAQLFHWPAQPANEFHSNNSSSLAHSWRFSLRDVDEVLRASLDLRRLNHEVAAFVEAPAEVAILYSQTSTLQLPPEMLTWQTTPYLAELHKTYEASRYLDAKVTFITERQILKGFLSRYKVLLIPGARNVPANVVDAIWTYARQGGQVLVVPESLLGDEYNHPQSYLATIGVSITRTQRPKTGQQGGMVQGYDQSFSHEVEFSSGPPKALRAASAAGEFSRARELRSSGVTQELSLSGGAEALFQYASGSAAITRTRLGKGAVYYSGSSLETAAYGRLLDALYTSAGVTRPVRVLDAGGALPDRVEARMASLGGRKLVYVSNYQNHSVELELNRSAEPVHSVKALRTGTESAGNSIAVSPGETEIYELF